MSNPGDPVIHDQVICDASAWTAAELSAQRDWELTLSDGQAQELLTQLTACKERNLPLAAIDARSFPLPGCEELLSCIRDQLRVGRGMALLHGFPVQDQAREDIERMYWGFCAHLGQGVTQNSDGSLIHYVTEGSLRPNQGTRGVGNPGTVSLHVDLADCVTLLCVRQATDSPPSRLASSSTLHNELLRLRPEALPRLYRGFVWDRQNEHSPMETPTTGFRVPFFSVRDGQVSCRYNRNWMTKAALRNGRGFSPADEELLDFIDELTHANCIEFDFQPGDVQFASNYTVLHGRAAHAPTSGGNDARLLMRIWFDMPHIRAFADEAVVRYGIIRHGKLGWSAEAAAAGLAGHLHPRRQHDQAPLLAATA